MSITTALPKPSTTKNMSVGELTVSNAVNIRFQDNQDVFGVKLGNGTYDLNSMEFDILEQGRIVQAIAVSERQDGSFIVLRGNRRTMAGQRLLAKSDTSKDVREALEKTPVQIYKNLTPEQELLLVNDQDNKQFLKSEMVRLICTLNNQGWDYNRIVLTYWRQLSQLTDTSAKKIQVEGITDREEQRKAIKAWFRGSVEQVIIAANNLGHHVRRLMMRNYLIADGLIKIDDQKEGVFKLEPKRLRELKTIQAAETKTWTPENGSLEFNKAIEKFIIEDANKPKRGPKEDNNRPSSNELLTRVANAKSRAYKASLNYARGEEVAEYEALDADTNRNETIMDAIAARVNNITDPMIGNMLRLIAFGRDVGELERVLDSLMVQQ